MQAWNRLRWLQIGALAAALAMFSGVGPAIELTCAGCLDLCCAWAFSSPEFRDLTGRFHQPYPCAHLLVDTYPQTKEWSRCVSRAFDRCFRERCGKCVRRVPGTPFEFRLPLDRGVSGSKSLRFSVGQVAVVDRTPSTGSDSPASDTNSSVTGVRTDAASKGENRD